jgi:hypothetical protein
MRVRSLTVAALLVVLCVPAASTAADSPCVADASLCVGATNPAECRSIAVMATSASPPRIAVSELVATVADPMPHGRSEHVADVHRPDGLPVAWFHAGAVESFCQAYLSGTGLANRKACGRAAIDEVVISLYPQIPIAVTARGVVEEGCASAGVPSGAVNHANFESIVVSVAGVTRSIPSEPPANTVVPLGADAYLALNETFVGATGCLQNQGDALRLVSGSTVVIVGWTSTSACS